MRAEVEARKQIGWNRHGNFVLEVRVQRTARSHSPSSQPSAPAPQVFGYEGPTMMILEAAKMTLRVQLNNDHSGDVALAVPCIRQVLVGLSELHKNGVVHMDIKPENIFLLERRGRVPVRARPKLRARASRPERTATPHSRLTGVEAWRFRRPPHGGRRRRPLHRFLRAARGGQGEGHGR